MHSSSGSDGGARLGEPAGVLGLVVGGGVRVRHQIAGRPIAASRDREPPSGRPPGRRQRTPPAGRPATPPAGSRPRLVAVSMPGSPADPGGDVGPDRRGPAAPRRRRGSGSAPLAAAPTSTAGARVVPKARRPAVRVADDRPARGRPVPVAAAGAAGQRKARPPCAPAAPSGWRRHVRVTSISIRAAREPGGGPPPRHVPARAEHRVGAPPRQHAPSRAAPRVGPANAVRFRGVTSPRQPAQRDQVLRVPR